MKNTKNLAAVLAAAVAICFALVSLLQSTPPAHAKLTLKYEPIWEITECDWVKHGPNPRFAICDHGTPDNDSDDLVLDTRTRLVWQREPLRQGEGEYAPACYPQAVIQTYRNEGTQPVVKGFRLPTIEEMLSLVDPTESAPALPAGHPFINVQWEDDIGTDWYWTVTHWRTNETFVVNFKDGNIDERTRSCEDELWVWRVWGGSARVDYIF